MIRRQEAAAAQWAHHQAADARARVLQQGDRHAPTPGVIGHGDLLHVTGIAQQSLQQFPAEQFDHGGKVREHHSTPRRGMPSRPGRM